LFLLQKLLILASDGLTDRTSAASIAEEAFGHETAAEAARALVEDAVYEGPFNPAGPAGQDNTTAVVVFFSV